VDDADNFFALAPGTRLDEYEIVSILGQGSFGITYLAEDVNLGARVAVKEYLPGDWAVRDSTKSVRPKSTSARNSFEWGMDAFLKEARILANVSHANIVKVRRFLRANGTAYIVMDFVEGRSFADVLTQDYPSGGFPGRLLQPMLVALLDGLAVVHKAGIIHRDIKPANILIAPDGRPILIDFGAARNLQRTLRSGMTVIMTPGYAPIEQYTEDGEQGAWSDIYSLGAVAYRALSGKAPMEPYKRISGGVQTSAASLGAAQYPSPLLSAVDWAISVHPKDRPQSVAALLASLEGGDADATRVVLESKPPPASTERAAATASASLIRPTRPRPRRLAVIAAALLGVGITVAALGYYGGFPIPHASLGERPPASDEAAKDEAARRAAATAAKEVAVEQAAEAAAKLVVGEVAKQAAAQQGAEEASKQAVVQAAQQAAAQAARQFAAAVARQEAARDAAAEAARREEAAKAAAAELAKHEAEVAAAKREAARRAAAEAERKATLAARREAERRAADEAPSTPQNQPPQPQPPAVTPPQNNAPAAVDYCQGRSVFSCQNPHHY
jgi:hypothetical protein